MAFIPDAEETVDFEVPYFEDAKADLAPLYSSRKSLDEAKNEVTSVLARMGAGAVRFVLGQFEGEPQRYGVRVEFVLGGAKGRIDVACLPIRRFKVAKLEQARVQALLNVRDWLMAAVTTRIFAPGGNPLVPYLLVDGETTLSQYLEALEDGLGTYLRSPSELPRLPKGEVLEGDFDPMEEEDA
jgi:hypothetical protein